MADELTPSNVGDFLIYQNTEGRVQVEVRYEAETVWLPHRLLAELFQVSVPTVNEHLTNVYSEGELDPGATIRKFRIVQRKGARCWVSCGRN